MKVAYHPCYVHPVPENHRFPMDKYELLVEQILHEGIIQESQLHTPKAISEHSILLTHEANYWQDLKQLKIPEKAQRASGFVHNNALIERELIITQGTLDMALYSLKKGIGFNIAGGTHHAFTNRGEGFCLLNDFACAAHHLLYHGHIKRALIIDLDVHQGNGTAQIFQNDPRVFTFSMHGKDNYPLRKERSSIDIALNTGTTDKEYHQALDKHLPSLIEKTDPDIIFYLSGVDVLSTDKLGHLALTINGCKERDEKVLNLAKNCRIPICIAMGGGYSPNIKTIIEAHTNTYRVANQIY